MLGDMRLFVAVVPPPEVLEHLELALRTVRGDDGRRGALRWSEPGDRHLTLAFYGEVPDGFREELTQELDATAAATATFELALRGAGVFDGRTVWVGCSGATDVLGRLMAAAGRIGADLLGRPADSRSRAHLTVARVRGRTRGRTRAEPRGAGRGGGSAPDADGGAASMPAPTSLAHALAVYTGPGWTVQDVVLMASDLAAGRGGAPRYDVVHRSPLGAVAG
jgi:2'-5' RNA ligase